MMSPKKNTPKTFVILGMNLQLTFFHTPSNKNVRLDLGNFNEYINYYCDSVVQFYRKKYSEISTKDIYEIELHNFNQHKDECHINQKIVLQNYLNHFHKTYVKKEKPKKITSLLELFESKKMMEKCIQVLRDVDPPILTEKNKIIGNKKGGIAVWYEILQSKGLIKNVNEKIFASLYSKEFEPISDSTFRKVNPRANDNYKDELNKLLSQL